MVIHITPDELRDTYEYKVAQRILKQDYPWIKEVTFKENELNEYNVIFLIIAIDVAEMSDTLNEPLAPYIKRDIPIDQMNPTLYTSPYLNSFLRKFNTKIQEDMDEKLHRIHTNKAIPRELKLPENRTLIVGTVIDSRLYYK